MWPHSQLRRVRGTYDGNFVLGAYKAPRLSLDALFPGLEKNLSGGVIAIMKIYASDGGSLAEGSGESQEVFTLEQPQECQEIFWKKTSQAWSSLTQDEMKGNNQ